MHGPDYGIDSGGSEHEADADAGDDYRDFPEELHTTFPNVRNRLPGHSGRFDGRQEPPPPDAQPAGASLRTGQSAWWSMHPIVIATSASPGGTPIWARPTVEQDRGRNVIGSDSRLHTMSIGIISRNQQWHPSRS